MIINTEITIELLHDLLTSTRDITDQLIIHDKKINKDLLIETYNSLETLIDNFETDLNKTWIDTINFYDNPNNCNRELN